MLHGIRNDDNDDRNDDSNDDRNDDRNDENRGITNNYYNDNRFIYLTTHKLML